MNSYNRRKKSVFVSRWRPEEALLIIDFLQDLKEMIEAAYGQDICHWCEQSHEVCQTDDECPF